MFKLKNVYCMFFIICMFLVFVNGCQKGGDQSSQQVQPTVVVSDNNLVTTPEPIKSETPVAPIKEKKKEQNLEKEKIPEYTAKTGKVDPFINPTLKKTGTGVVSGDVSITGQGIDGTQLGIGTPGIQVQAVFWRYGHYGVIANINGENKIIRPGQKINGVTLTEVTGKKAIFLTETGDEIEYFLPKINKNGSVDVPQAKNLTLPEAPSEIPTTTQQQNQQSQPNNQQGQPNTQNQQDQPNQQNQQGQPNTQTQQGQPNTQNQTVEQPGTNVPVVNPGTGK